MTELNNSHIIPLSFWVASFVGLISASALAFLLHKLYLKEKIKISSFYSWYDYVIQVVRAPLVFFVSMYALYLLINIAETYSRFSIPPNIQIYIPYLVRIGEFVIYFWLILNALRIGKQKVIAWSTAENKTASILLIMLSNSLQAAIFLLMLNMLIPALGLSGTPLLLATKLSKLFLIGILGWIFYKFVDSLSRIIINQYMQQNVDLITSRKINTQVIILKRVVLTIGLVITIASMLMVFDSVKNLGTGLLTTAGIVSAAGAFASQQSLGRLFAGLQIAFTQPIRIGDTVIINDEFGQIEEITLSYIVVKIWDLRRLILPTDYFTNKGLQNLTRESTQLLGTVYVYTDYTLPVATVRKKFQEILAQSPLWDKKVSAFEVTDIKENSLEIRALMSADNASTLWNLRCEVREKLMDYIVKHHPECLAAKRNLAIPVEKRIPQAIDEKI